ncbi:MAG: stage V sporulation protein AE [Clostridiales bacterium]|jgi:stage V sporulation protein AE|nr:stage V sporulation protein AE [Clostridiales bacterium]
MKELVLEYLKVFVVGGLICVIGQILLDKTKLTSARILVLFVVAGCFLGAIGIYEKLADFAGAGATVPLPGFGYNLYKGVCAEIDQNGFLGVFTGGIKAAAAGVAAAIIFGFLASLLFNAKEK